MRNKSIVLILLALIMPYANVHAATIFSVTTPETILQFIQGHSTIVFLMSFFVIGVLLSFTPCVLPMVPILSGIIVGQDKLSSYQGFKLSLSYVLGMAVSYAIAGMLAGFFGSTVQTLMQTPIVITAFSLLFVALGLSLMGYFEISTPLALQSVLSQQQSRRSYISIALMGMLSALVASPCVTAPLIGVLSYIAQSGQVFLGGLILFVMALGMGVPLLLIGLGFGKFLPKAGAWMIKVKQIFGLMMFAIALMMLSRILPTQLSFLLFGILAAVAVFSLFDINNKVLALPALGLATAITVVPLYSQHENQQTLAFIEAKTLEQINNYVAQAKHNHKPLFIEFYATWCSDCKAMNRLVFNQQSVIDALKTVNKVRVDISNNSHEVKRIKKAFNILGIPTLHFYTADGHLEQSLTTAGFVDKQQVITSIKQVV